MGISSATVQTATAVAWSTGDLFDGYLVVKLVPPDGKTFVVWENSGERTTTRFVFPIVDGVISDVPKLPYTNSFTPPNAVYRAFWVDKALNQVASGAGLFSVIASPYTITPETLTAPDAETVPPSLDVLPTDPGVGSGITAETIEGTKDGANTTFTISRNATIVMVFLNQGFMTEGVGYTRAGATITAVAPYIPQTGDLYKAILIQ